MNRLVSTYTFDASAKTVDSADFPTLENILLITNVTDNVIIYNFAAPTKGGSLSGTTLTLTYDTTSMSDTDKLQIIVDDGGSTLDDIDNNLIDIKTDTSDIVSNTADINDIKTQQTDKSQFTKLTDGTDTALITAAGEQNVLATAQPGVDIGDVTINNASGGSAVNIQDGGNSITVDNGGTFAVQATAADGAIVTLGAKADAKSTATDSTAITMMQVLKQISASVQAPPSQAVTNTGTFAVQATLQTQTDTVMVGGINVKEINAVTPLMGNGVTGTGSQRVTIASDNTPFPVKTDQTTHGTTDLVAADITKVAGASISQGHGTAATAIRVELPTDGTGIVGLAAGTNGIGKLTANSGVTIGAVEIAAAQTLGTVTTVSTVTNLAQMNGAAISMGVGATGTGVQRVVQANDAGKTILSKGGSAASNGDNTLIAAGTNKLKVVAFSLTTTSTTAMTCIFQSGGSGTELWRVILQAPSGASTGANLSVNLPAYLFATASATLLNLNLSSANAVHWSVSYIDEA